MRLSLMCLVFAYILVVQGAPVPRRAAIESRREQKSDMKIEITPTLVFSDGGGGGGGSPGRVISPPGPILRQFIHPKVNGKLLSASHTSITYAAYRTGGRRIGCYNMVSIFGIVDCARLAYHHIPAVDPDYPRASRSYNTRC